MGSILALHRANRSYRCMHSLPASGQSQVIWQELRRRGGRPSYTGSIHSDRVRRPALRDLIVPALASIGNSWFCIYVIPPERPPSCCCHRRGTNGIRQSQRRSQFGPLPECRHDSWRQSANSTTAMNPTKSMRRGRLFPSKNVLKSRSRTFTNPKTSCSSCMNRTRSSSGQSTARLTPEAVP